MSDSKDLKELGTAIHYTAVQPGTPVFSSDGDAVGKVRKVHDNFAEHILDGFEIEADDGTIRFVDGPEVQRTFERGVTLGITADELDSHAPVQSKDTLGGGGTGAAGGGSGGRLGRLFGRRG